MAPCTACSSQVSPSAPTEVQLMSSAAGTRAPASGRSARETTEGPRRRMNVAPRLSASPPRSASTHPMAIAVAGAGSALPRA